MAKLVLAAITSGYAAVSALNANFDAIEAALENTLSRDGTAPNSMSANLDMDSNRILNLPDGSNASEPATVRQLQAASGLAAAFPSQTGHDGKVLKTDGTVVSWLQLTATLIPVTPSGNLAADDVQEALVELQTDIDTRATSAAVALKAPLASPALTGTPTAPTAAADTNTTQLATTAFVMGQLPRKNAIINGDFNVPQRGTSFASIANGSYHLDRWRYAKVGAMVHDVSQSTDVPTVAEAGRLFSYSLLVDCTTADGAIAAGDLCAVLQAIEGYNFLPLAQRAITLSFWVKATKTGVYCVAARNSGTDRSYVGEYTVSAADTWEKKTVTLTASPSAGTWNYTNGLGLDVAFTLAAGTTFQTTGGAWQTGNFFATANQVNACDDTANNFRICGVQLEPGSVATAFETRFWHDEYDLCRRYYQNIGWDDTEDVCMAAFNSDTTAAVGVFHYPVPMRTNPGVSFSGGADYVVQTNAGNTATNSITGALNIGRTVCTIAMGTAGGLSSGQGSIIRAGNANARIQLNAEL